MKRTQINPVSAKRRQRDRFYPRAREAVLERSRGLCEAGTRECIGRVECVHHIAGRLGPDPHRLENLLGMCEPCHRYAHAHPAISYERGWMARRTGAA